MARINVNAFKSRLIVSFLTMAVITVALVVFTTVQFLQMKSLAEYNAYVLENSLLYSNKLARYVHKSNTMLQAYVTSGDASLNDSQKLLMENEATDMLDSLAYLEPRWDNDELTVLYNDLSSTFNDIKKLQGEISEQAGNSPDAALQTYSDRMVNLVADFEQTLSMLNEGIELSSVQNTNTVYKAADYFKLAELAALLLAFVIVFLLYRSLSRRIMNSISLVKEKMQVLSRGDLPEIGKQNYNDELNVVREEINTLTQNLGNVKEFALEVGNGNFDTTISVFNNEGEIGRSLAEMRNSLQRVAEEERERTWVNKGFALFGDILRKHSDNLEELSLELITQLVKYLKATQGGIFIVEGASEQDKVLRLSACYAYDRQKFLNKTVEVGQGLVGQCYLEQKSIFMKEVPEEYVRISSGMGESNPTSIFIVPLMTNKTVYGVIELASFSEFTQSEMDFLEQLSENIASAISSVKSAANTKKLLEESQSMTEQMRAQEEEMRQNMEELQATQEEVERKSREQHEFTDAMNKTSIIVEMDASGNITDVNDMFCEVLHYDKGDVIDKTEHYYATPTTTEDITFRKLWESLEAGTHFSRDLERKRKDGNKVWIRTSYMPIMDDDGHLRKIMAIGFDVTDEKKKQLTDAKRLEEMERQSNELKEKVQELERKMANAKAQEKQAIKKENNGGQQVKELAKQQTQAYQSLTDKLKGNTANLKKFLGG